MEFQDLIETRRTVRKYDTSKKVQKEDIEKLIAAAIETPSWKNQQTSRYHCILDEELAAKFRSECLPSFNAQRSEGAALIVCTFVKDIVGFNTVNGAPTNEVANGWGCYDLGIQTENIILKAKELGLDSLIMGIRNADKIKTLLGIPKEEVVVSVIAVGYGDQSPEKPHKKPVEEVAKFY